MSSVSSLQSLVLRASPPSAGPSRSVAARLGQEAVRIAQGGVYRAPSGKEVSVAEAVARAVEGTRELPPTASLPAARARGSAPRVHVLNGTSLEAARALVEAGVSPCVLNFASAKNPGGGFLGGAIAQEEVLARSSALHACLEGRAMYAHHRAQRSPLYTSWVIHSPNVPVFRTDGGELLEEPYLASFLTAAAVNAGVARERGTDVAGAIAGAMRERTARVLAVAEAMGERALVLGAWGCGVFRNDPEMVAGHFDEVLAEMRGAFDVVVFAVLDTSAERRNYAPFARRFAGVT